MPRGLLCLFLTLLTALPGARAQEAQAAGAGSEVEIRADLLGVGDVIRPGDWTGVRLTLLDRSDRVRAAVVRLQLRDADGDTAFHQRSVVLNPGRVLPVWLYPQFPFSFSSGDILTVTVHAAPGDDVAPGGLEVGRQIGAARFNARSVIDSGSAMIGVLGRQRMGLEHYSSRGPRRSDYPGTAHESVELVIDLTPSDLPDAWMGLAPFETLVWAEGEPSELADEAAEALREWVYRGGHLVVVLPPVGQTWTNPRNPLIDLTPASRIERREQADIESYRALLTRSETAPLPRTGVVHSFIADEGAQPGEATPILSGPGGEHVVMRRIVGLGAVTMVGFDLTSSRLAGRVHPQQFWHRVLGKRFDALSSAEMVDLENEGAADFTNRTRVWLDDDIAGQINMTGRAGAGVLLALVVFTAYLLLAGPLGFAVLKARNMKQHAWVGFLAMAGLFTLIAWGGATTLRPTTVEVRHLTFIDHVYGQPVDRARSWFSVLLPTYGSQEISVGEMEPGMGLWRQALTPWSPPQRLEGGAFPDAREYAIDSRRPETITAPTRSTVKQFQADWMGGPPWRMPTPDPNNSVRIDEQDRLAGVLDHGLPASLEDVQIVLVRRQRPLTATGRGGPLLAQSLAWSLPRPWEPETPLDLGELTASGAQSDMALGDQFFATLAGRGQQFGSEFGLPGQTGDLRHAPTKFSMLAWHPMLAPPDWRSTRSGAKPMLQRRAAHGYDLGMWFTQPSLIIVGHLVDAESPVPVRVDGRPVMSSGRTVVRWVFPLAPDPVAPTRIEER
ncbi:MAG: hypothetical protein EA376_07560 [Phycisphaeraceae bacterium]|nr:MAG: hypothetical protein EA376_07560 [Phycisphaeraceae bacterium]